MEKQEWLAQRKHHIGGSDVAAILGLSRYRTAWDVFVDKTSKEVDTADKPWFKRGRYLERAIGDWYSDEHGVELDHKQHELFIGPEPWMAASPDFLVKADPKYGLECKTARQVDGWGDSGTDVVPIEYGIQVAWYMACLGYERWDTAVFLTLKDEFRSYVHRVDPEVQQKIIDECRKWWERHVVKGIVPPMDGSSAASEWLKQRFPQEKTELRRATSDEVEMALEIQGIAKQQGELKKRRDTLENQLKFSLGEAEGIEWGATPKRCTVTYKHQVRKGYTYTVEPGETRVLRRNIKG